MGNLVEDIIANPMVVAGRAPANPVHANSPTKPARSTKTKNRMLKERTDLPIEDRYVSMSNALARGAQGLSLSQKRIIALAMAKTDSLPISDLQNASRGGWSIRLCANEYAEAYDVDARTAYDQLQMTSRSLLKTLWRAVREKIDGPPGQRGPRILEGPWLTLAEYSKGEGSVEITFNPAISIHLLGLRTQFTTYKLKQAAALRSIYAWRLFECLQSWKKEGCWECTIEEFQHAMEAPVSCCANFGMLNRTVIQPAIKELRQKDGLIIDLKLNKAGRKVIGLSFTFYPDPQWRIPLDPNEQSGAAS